MAHLIQPCNSSHPKINSSRYLLVSFYALNADVLGKGRRKPNIYAALEKSEEFFYFFRFVTALVGFNAAERAIAFTARCSSAAMNSLIAG